MKLIQVALPSPLRQVFDYRLPAGAPIPVAGVRVRVPFGRQALIGLVTEVVSESNVPTAKLKSVTEILDVQPALPPALWTLARWAAQYYQHPLGDALSQMLPVLIRQGEPLLAPQPQVWRLTARGQALVPDGLRRAARQQQAWQLLNEHRQGLSSTALQALGVSREALLALQEKELVERIALAAPATAMAVTPLLAEASLSLNTEQAAALSLLTAQTGFRVTLLQGITGSGKTEVYLQHIERVLQAGQQVLILVPEIGLTPQTVARFRARFRCAVAVLHSGLTDNERLSAWRAARAGEVSLIIGTRSAVFTPMARPGLIIVDEEHDLSFKQQEGFRYNGRDVAVRRAQLENIPIVLGSATPALESIANVQAGRYQRLSLTQRAGGAQAPMVRCLDLRGQPVQDGLCAAARQTITETLARGEQVLVFINRRGFAPVMLCHDCGWQAECSRCDARPTLHRDPVRLHCHHCGFEQAPPRHCPSCNSSDLRPVGVGTERLEQALIAAHPGIPVHRVDRDSTRRKGALQGLLDEIHKPGPALLVGTQMLAKGHHFPRVTLVLIPDVDGALFSADFRGGERLAQLLVQVAGRAGRGDKPGQMWLQTHQPEHPLLVTLLSQGYIAAARTLLNERQLLGLPPAGYLALLRAEATRADLPLTFLQQAAVEIVQGKYGVQAWGPVPAPMARKAGLNRVHLLLKADDRKTLHALLATLVPWLDALPSARQVRWSIDVDPQELQ